MSAGPPEHDLRPIAIGTRMAPSRSLVAGTRYFGKVESQHMMGDGSVSRQEM